MSKTVMSPMGASIRLRAGRDEHVVDLDAGALRVWGIAGPRALGCSFRQYFQVGEDPGALAFLRMHDVVDVIYTTEETGWGAKADRTLEVLGCTLSDFVLVEEATGVMVEYQFGAKELAGDLFRSAP